MTYENADTDAAQIADTSAVRRKYIFNRKEFKNSKIEFITFSFGVVDLRERAASEIFSTIWLTFVAPLMTYVRAYPRQVWYLLSLTGKGLKSQNLFYIYIFRCLRRRNL